MSFRNAAIARENDRATPPAPAPTPPPAAPPTPAPAPASAPVEMSAPDLADTVPAPETELRALGREALDHAEQGAPATTPAAQAHSGTVGEEDDDPSVDLGRVAWLVTVLACLLAVAITALDGYLGYAGVTLAVAAAAGINLF